MNNSKFSSICLLYSIPHKRRHLYIYATYDSELWAEVRRGQRSGSLASSLIAASQRWPPIRSNPFFYFNEKREKMHVFYHI
jgi:hypothetical protein